VSSQLRKETVLLREKILFSRSVDKEQGQAAFTAMHVEACKRNVRGV
jgi:hypothetical protein